MLSGLEACWTPAVPGVCAGRGKVRPTAGKSSAVHQTGFTTASCCEGQAGPDPMSRSLRATWNIEGGIGCR
jgi:hypothetical protein